MDNSNVLEAEPTAIEKAKRLATAEVGRIHDFALDPSNFSIIERAQRLRVVETTLLELFGRGMLHGTIHTCVGLRKRRSQRRQVLLPIRHCETLKLDTTAADARYFLASNFL
jgi:hypothetical protein